MTDCVLTINGGSSTIKFALFERGDNHACLLTGKAERIGLPDAVLVTTNHDSGVSTRIPIAAPDHLGAMEQLTAVLRKQMGPASVVAVGHRIVHGGPRYSDSTLVTPAVITELQRLCPLDPAHLPSEIALLEACARQFPGCPQIACFDTAFHHALPTPSQILPIPRRYAQQGVRRYGFHGLSYAFLMGELERIAGTEAARGRVILAHLGSGASMAAVKGGRCIDTSMSFTPSAGLVMGTRSGDIDPGFLTYLMRTEQLNADQIDKLINQQSGLLGISETSSDIRDLLAREQEDARAADAIQVFCYQIKKWIGALAAALGGIDSLVFAGGIGENSPEVRARICSDLDFLGIRLDNTRNSKNSAVISETDASAVVRVIRTNEELMIVREVLKVLGN